VSTGPLPVYDSAERTRPVIGQMQTIWRHRRLLRLLITRDVSVKYKRSLLGVWWTLLTPVLTMLCMWLVFSRLFRFATPGIPYTVYLLSGVVVVSFFQQAVAAVGASTVANADVLTKVYAPPELFSLAAAAAAGVTFVASLLPLAVLEIITGVGVPWTMVLVPLLAVALLALVSGCGLLVASIAVRYYDALDLTRIVLLLAGYLSPVFYPTSILSERVHTLLKLNPLYHFLLVGRALIVHRSSAPIVSYVVVGLSGMVAFVLGSWAFERSWRRQATML
jgi:ABC-type polysaccharide/polyol phosphate export permease